MCIPSVSLLSLKLTKTAVNKNNGFYQLQAANTNAIIMASNKTIATKHWKT